MNTKTLTKTEVATLVAQTKTEMAASQKRWEPMTWGCPTRFPE